MGHRRPTDKPGVGHQDRHFSLLREAWLRRCHLGGWSAVLCATRQRPPCARWLAASPSKPPKMRRALVGDVDEMAPSEAAAIGPQRTILSVSRSSCDVPEYLQRHGNQAPSIQSPCSEEADEGEEGESGWRGACCDGGSGCFGGLSPVFLSLSYLYGACRRSANIPARARRLLVQPAQLPTLRTCAPLPICAPRVTSGPDDPGMPRMSEIFGPLQPRSATQTLPVRIAAFTSRDRLYWALRISLP
ncbi:hypothetical protein B0T11DRAFT_98662 [Plectosphaerella cucumerina]|uniref:Uncharacterized protein n=1 Tax=Plectosphaerella cucumerina TaxID=40658 RepID=A0A8K0TAG3_9PEZI|nr:hypothetical protein B0T11DRAFT_98662 [Plectosphaerella cucumerina]